MVVLLCRAMTTIVMECWRKRTWKKKNQRLWLPYSGVRHGKSSHGVHVRFHNYSHFYYLPLPIQNCKIVGIFGFDMGHFTHTWLKVRDQCILRYLTGWKGWDCPSSLHTRRWRPRTQRKIPRMKVYVNLYKAYYR